MAGADIREFDTPSRAEHPLNVALRALDASRKPVVAAGLWLYALATLLCALAPSITTLLGARLLQGLAAASGPVIARAIVRDRYRAEDAARI